MDGNSMDEGIHQAIGMRQLLGSGQRLTDARSRPGQDSPVRSGSRQDGSSTIPRDPGIPPGDLGHCAAEDRTGPMPARSSPGPEPTRHERTRRIPFRSGPHSGESHRAHVAPAAGDPRPSPAPPGVPRARREIQTAPMSTSDSCAVSPTCSHNSRARVQTGPISGALGPRRESSDAPRVRCNPSSYPARAGVSGNSVSTSRPLVQCATASRCAERAAACSPARCQYGMACSLQPRLGVVMCQHLGLRFHHGGKPCHQHLGNLPMILLPRVA